MTANGLGLGEVAEPKAQFSTALRFLFFERWQIADDRKQNNNILNYRL